MFLCGMRELQQQRSHTSMAIPERGIDKLIFQLHEMLPNNGEQ